MISGARQEAVICEPVRTPIGRYGAMFTSSSGGGQGLAAVFERVT